MTDIVELHRRAVRGFGDHVHAVKDDQWEAPTPDDEWNVRDLVNHLVGENLWTKPLMQGKTIEEVGSAFDGDVLGEDPVVSWDSSADSALVAAGEPGAMDRTVHLSFGDTPATEYLYQLFADHLIHGWDLARAIGADENLDPELVEACATWFAEREELYRQAGAIADRPDVPEDADPQIRLLAAFGRSS